MVSVSLERQEEGEAIVVTCRDGYELGGHYWHAANGRPIGTVIVNAATGVLARYYHYYARFLTAQGFAVVTYDYRGIGASRPPSFRGLRLRWRDWGELDFDAVLRWAADRADAGPLSVVGHSIGGFLPGFSSSTGLIDRVLTVGAQYAYWRDYAAAKRMRMFLKWHLAMPLITSVCGYFPGRRLGWLEDLPADVVREWSFRPARFEESYPFVEREGILARFAAVRAPILAVGMADDEFGTPQAILRGLRYYRGSERRQIMLQPTDLGFDAVGHFGLFHGRHVDGFWQSTVSWLRDGTNPWQSAVLLSAALD